MRLLVIFGPPAVGKMTVGREVAARSSFRVFHNHASIEPLLEVFDFGVPSFNRLLAEWRRRVVEEAALSEVDLLLTFVWGLALAEDRDLIASYAEIYEAAGGEVRFVELYADLPTRLDRNRTELRLAEKKSKRDLEWSDANVRELDELHVSTDPSNPTVADEVLSQRPFLRLDNTALGPDAAAELILKWLTDPEAS
jgi:hypothetical protein